MCSQNTAVPGALGPAYLHQAAHLVAKNASNFAVQPLILIRRCASIVNYL